MQACMVDIQKNIPLAPLTTFKIGGMARFFTEVRNEAELLEALDYARKNSLEIFMLGGGSNVLFSDNGFDGLIIKMQENKEDECWTGNSLAGLVSFCKENSFSGMEWATGIPGTIGGAVRGNAGAYGGCMADSIESVRVFNLENDKISEYLCADCQFTYRGSAFKRKKELIILSVKLKFEKGEQEIIAEKMQEIITKRTTALPKGFSAGSFFQNPVVENSELIQKFEKDARVKARDGKIPAGWLIEEAGFKGKKIGGITVSEKHANFFINDGTATAENVMILSSMIKQKLREEFDVQLKEEIAFAGF